MSILAIVPIINEGNDARLFISNYKHTLLPWADQIVFLLKNPTRAIKERIRDTFEIKKEDLGHFPKLGYDKSGKFGFVIGDCISESLTKSLLLVNKKATYKVLIAEPYTYITEYCMKCVNEFYKEALLITGVPIDKNHLYSHIVRNEKEFSDELAYRDFNKEEFFSVFKRKMYKTMPSRVIICRGAMVSTIYEGVAGLDGDYGYVESILKAFVDAGTIPHYLNPMSVLYPGGHE